MHVRARQQGNLRGSGSHCRGPKPALASPGKLVELHMLRAHPDLLNQKLWVVVGGG